MKSTIHKFLPRLAVLGAIVISANVAFGQSEMDTTTTRTTSVGTVRAMDPDSITVTTRSSPTPVHYVFTKTTSYVDENGNPVSVETVRSGAPVTVYYDQDGDRLVASKVVVRKHVDMGDGVAQTTTTTSAEGTVNQFSPDAIAVTTPNSPTPINYTFTKTTSYVDENGNPVSVDVVRTGVPVTVYYDYVNGNPIASKVVVRRSAVTADAPVIVEKKTTTTTTTTTDPNP